MSLLFWRWVGIRGWGRGKVDSVMLCLRGVCFLLLAGNGGVLIVVYFTFGVKG